MRSAKKVLYHLDMNKFQKKSDGEMNYFRTELIRYYIHNFKRMSLGQRECILNEIPFNTHFCWNFNLVSVLTFMGQKNEVITDLFNHGVPYITEVDGTTPLIRADKMNDRNVVDAILSHFRKDANELEFQDLKLILQKFMQSWRNNFQFLPTQLTYGAKEKIKGGFIGCVKPGKQFIFKTRKMVGIRDLEACIDFESGDSCALLSETFSVQLNFDFKTEICFELLEQFIQANLDFFEYTQIHSVIDFIFEQNKTKFVLFNHLYVSQAVMVSINQLYPDFAVAVWLSYILACVILAIEAIQLIQDPKDYIKNPYNWLESSGNILVLLSQMP